VADAQVTAAIANWGPRFTAQGVDPGDFARVTGGIDLEAAGAAGQRGFQGVASLG
jgi:hypothetical protein